MSDNKNNYFKVKPLFAYFKEGIKYYDLDNPNIAHTVFVLILAIVFGGNVLARPYIEKVMVYFEQLTIQLSEQNLDAFDISSLDTELIYNMTEALLITMGILLLVKALSYLVSLFYGSYYFYSLTRPETTLNQRIGMFFQRLPKLLGFNILYYLMFGLGILILFMVMSIIGMFFPSLFIIFSPVIPILVIIIDLVFTFKNLLIIQYDVSIPENFKKSLEIIRECKARVINNGLTPHILLLLLASAPSGISNQLLALFIVAFIEVILVLFSSRLTTLMFLDVTDLKRADKKLKKISDFE